MDARLRKRSADEIKKLLTKAFSKRIRVHVASGDEDTSVHSVAATSRVYVAKKEEQRLAPCDPSRGEEQSSEGYYYVSPGPSLRIACRSVLETALRKRFTPTRSGAMPASRRSGDTFFVIVDGNVGRATETDAYQTHVIHGSYESRSRAQPNRQRMSVVVFTRFSLLVRMGYKHVLADAMQTFSSDGGASHFIPETYSALRRPPARLKGMWFLKPAFEAEGRGIQVLQDPSNVTLPAKPAMVLQKGVDPPMLYKGHKFDVRIWVTVRGDGHYVVHNNGRLRFSHVPYVRSASADPSTHITNVAYQPDGEWRKQWPTRLSDIPELYTSFMRQVREQVRDVLQCAFNRDVQDAGSGPVNAVRDETMFHITGWDFIMSGDGKVYLLELNASPAAHDADDAARLYVEWCEEAIRFATQGPEHVRAQKIDITAVQNSVSPYRLKARKMLK